MIKNPSDLIHQHLEALTDPTEAVLTHVDAMQAETRGKFDPNTLHERCHTMVREFVTSVLEFTKDVEEVFTITQAVFDGIGLASVTQAVVQEGFAGAES
jgi:hypothetical protein